MDTIVPARPPSVATAIAPRRLDGRHAIRDAAFIVVPLVVIARATGVLLPDAPDLHAYWVAGIAQPCANSHAGAVDAYLYSPALTQLMEPLRALPWNVVVGLMTLLSLTILVSLAPAAWPLLMLVFISDIASGNIHLVFAAMIVLGFRWPGLWAFGLLTKVTVGVGLLWFAVRGEWRSLAVALSTTGIVVLVSSALAPGLWLEWVATLWFNATHASVYPPLIAVPLWVRLPIAVVVICWGARTDRRWTVPVATMLALPILWPAALAVLAAVVPLASTDRRRLGHTSGGHGWPVWRRRRWGAPTRASPP